ncbi:hypothetical protein [Polymorphobacter fuscus]|uniref:hypothetical protein n=1 Tax=Sandarakinorhabdus fusca TaxID=1439888 RepID=UPI00129814BA|nr:hypothetical protein [Polymorphobacter fuscus]NJC08242.1 hypothetical protein [Polymorphobacter fuscus]
MIVFEVVKDANGWAVRRDRTMMMPASCRDAAVAAAERMVNACARHGQIAQLHMVGLS